MLKEQKTRVYGGPDQPQRTGSPREPLASGELRAATALVRAKGYAFVPAARFGADFVASASWSGLAEAFDRLPVDRYLRAGATFRRRRYGRFTLTEDGGLLDEPLAPYFQALEFNGYAGGIDRVYEDLEPGTRRNEALAALIATDAELFRACYPTTSRFRVDVHLFRILANGGDEGLPTPEGLHRDGNDGFAVHMVSRRCEGGVSRICSNAGESLEELILSQPLDTLYVNDNMVLHEVSPIAPSGEGAGIRDVVIVDFYRTN